MIKVLVSGAAGRMGREVVTAVSAQRDMVVAAQIDIGDDLRAALAAAAPDVAIDFTTPASAYANARAIIEAGVRPVIGTTGLTPDEVGALVALAGSARLGGVIAPNFAIGAVLLMHYAAHAARFLPRAEIIELHHDAKIDAPSGTARMTAERMAAARGLAPAAPHDARGGFRGGAVGGIPIHSVRLEGFVAHQEVIFGAQGQALTLRHDSFNRESFMPGVVLAVRESMRLDRVVVGLEKILGL
ncbi:MAG TPA: 4-hydroxy-tetrahydrodipicolinate reductase [Planctomycetes bacterium]|nr:4-hydroxy-tetrahydrodipicolinate reductase [Planctomycetota bacterium]